VLPLLQLVVLLGITMPVATGAMIVVFREVPQLASLVGDLPPVVTSWIFYRDAVLLATVLYFGSLLLGMIMVVTVPRLLRLLVRPDRDYRLYGIRYWAHRSISRLTNRAVFTRIYGDSSYIVHYLRSIGYDLSNVVQTGSNFGTAVKHDNPFLTTVGSATMVADGLSVINADYSSSHFRVSRVAIGAHNFLGNRVAYPTQGRTGDNCLLATKVMVPLDGPVREGSGLLGSPSFEIPRTVHRDLRLDVNDPVERRRKVLAKTRHNTVSILLLLASRWLLTCLLTVLTLGAVDLYSEFGTAVAALIGCLALPLTTAYFLLLDRLMRGHLAHRPDGCSIYDRAFWRHERYWKICPDTHLQLFNGTPFKNVLWRLLGVRIGRRVFDDGCSVTGRVFVDIGDRSTLNAGSVIQCHSQEDGAFKSDRSALGRRSTLGVGAFVHYGVLIDGAVLIEADSLVMKGSVVPAGARWGGNPATDLGDPVSGEPQFRPRRCTRSHTRNEGHARDDTRLARSRPGI
jgi:non-ribosomal peptide synthetase-like protein